MTKREFFEAVVSGTVTEEMQEMAKKYIAQMDTRNANRKPSAKQIENESIKEEILEVLAGQDPMTVTEIVSALGNAELTNQRVSALLTQLKNSERVIRVTDKRKALFKVA